MSALKPPQINTHIEDPGAHELSDSEDHFSSASEGTSDTNPKRLSAPSSPIPTTRVERVDDEPAHGEVPGTPAYKIRTQDAVPDEIEVIPDGQRSRSGTRGRAMSSLSGTGADSERAQTPGGSPIPKTVVERVDDRPAHGEVDGTLAKEMRGADAEPDEVRTAPEGSSAGREVSPVGDEQQAWFRQMWEGKQAPEDSVEPEAGDEATERDEDEDDGFGDDFDEFADEGGDEDFGDFDAGEEARVEASPPSSHPLPPPDILAGLPALNLNGLSHAQVQEAFEPYFAAIFPETPPTSLETPPPISAPKATPFLSDRSLSLWQQLVSPPPMQPPDWTRSRIRRLFLVSLGVPVDLDEILPPSKQKRLILPNVNLAPSPSGEGRASAAIDRLKHGSANTSTASLDSKTGLPKPNPAGSSSSRRTAAASSSKAPPPPPDFDTNAAALLCGTMEVAMRGFEDEELRAHVLTLETLNRKASAVLEYWLQRKDEGLREKEALEGVIENLVGFVKGRRGR